MTDISDPRHEAAGCPCCGQAPCCVTQAAQRDRLDRFAAAALMGFGTDSELLDGTTYEEIADHAWRQARAMIEREPKP